MYKTQDNHMYDTQKYWIWQEFKVDERPVKKKVIQWKNVIEVIKHVKVVCRTDVITHPSLQERGDEVDHTVTSVC